MGLLRLGALMLLVPLLRAQTTVPAPLLGTVVDPDGRPLAGVMVEVWRAAGRDMGSCLDIDYRHTYRRLTRTPTDKNGCFGLQLPTGLSSQLRVDAPPFARWVRDGEGPGELRIELQQPATLVGRIAFADGSAAPAKLRAWDAARTEVLRSYTDAQGRFCCERLPAGAITFEVLPDAARPPAWQHIVLEAGNTVACNLTVDAGRILRGRITDAATGRPIAGARVAEGWVLRRPAITDADGRYELRGFGADGEGEVHCVASDYVRTLTRRATLADGPVVTFDQQLERGNAVSGRVVDAEGEPLTDVYVGAVGMAISDGVQYHYWISTRTNPDGGFQLQGVRRDLPPTLVLRRDGWATLIYSLPAAVNGEHAAGVLTMRQARIVRGRVLGADGKPLARVKVGLWGANDDRERYVPAPEIPPLRGSPDLFDMYVALHEGWTDAQGHFAFGDTPSGEFSLVVYSAENRPLASRKDFPVTADADPATIEIRVRRE